MANHCVERHLSVAQLDSQIQSDLWYMSKSLKLDDGYGSPLFDVKECESCDFRMNIAHPYGNNKKAYRCTKDECWEKKQEAVGKELAKQVKAQMKGKGLKILTDKDISYDQRNDLDGPHLRELDNPKECETCESVALFQYSRNDSRPQKICIDKACYRRKKTKRTKDENKRKKELDLNLTEKLGDIFLEASKDPIACLRVITKRLIPHLGAEGKQNFCKNFADIPKLPNGRIDEPATDKHLATLNFEELLQRAVGATIIAKRRSESYDFSTSLSEGLKKDVALLQNKVDDYNAKEAAFRKDNCSGCTYCDDDLIAKPEEECCVNNAWARRVGDDGKCSGRLIVGAAWHGCRIFLGK